MVDHQNLSRPDLMQVCSLGFLQIKTNSSVRVNNAKDEQETGFQCLPLGPCTRIYNINPLKPLMEAAALYLWTQCHIQ